MSRINQNKPYIKQLEEGPRQKKDEFFKIVNQNYGGKINDWIQELSAQVKDKLDINTYLKNIAL